MVWGAPRGIDDILARVRANDASLTSLYLMRQRRFEEADARALCDALAKNTILKDLNISSHAISPSIAAMFASLLSATASLNSLDLGNSTFGDAVRIIIYRKYTFLSTLFALFNHAFNVLDWTLLKNRL